MTTTRSFIASMKRVIMFASLCGVLFMCFVHCASAQVHVQSDGKDMKKSSLRGGSVQQQQYSQQGRIDLNEDEPETITDDNRNLRQIDEVILTNGVIKLGINDFGALIVSGGTPSVTTEGGDTTNLVGLRYFLPDGSGESEGIAQGSLMEGWGVYGDGDAAYAAYGRENGIDQRSVIFQPSVDAMRRNVVKSTVDIEGGKLQVIHDFHFHPTISNLSEISIIIKNVGRETITDTRYRRVIGFDASPTVSTLPLRHMYIIQFLRETILFFETGWNTTRTDFLSIHILLLLILS